MRFGSALWKLIGLGALGLAAYQGAHAIPLMIQTYRAVETPTSTPPQVLPNTATVPPLVSASPNPQSQSSAAGSSSALPIDATSSNWAGIVQVGSQEKSVKATWTVPTISGAQPGSAVAEWVGLGGMQKSKLIQIGTITTASSTGRGETLVFWEELPASANQTAQLPSGATVTASITPAGQDTWRLQLRAKGQSSPLINKVIALSPNQAAAVETSADWITEAPTTNNGVAQLAPITSTTMSGVTANDTPLAQLSPSSLETVGLYDKSGNLQAAPTSTKNNSIQVSTVYGNLPQSGGNGQFTITIVPGSGGSFGNSNGGGYGYGGGYGADGGYGYGYGGGQSGGYGYGYGGY